ncbi:MAG: hypothetical protein LBV09_04655 [Deferribacteraceae bacterium]|jgi:predicted nucleotidyltransferase|nr:hypothetical protein [Deferribacteraceae bacterium]
MLTEKTIAILREKAEAYHVKRLLLFGSCLYKPEAEAGDIDLAVEGIDDDRFIPFLSELLFNKEINKSVDLVDMSDDLGIVHIVREDNMVIYES